MQTRPSAQNRRFTLILGLVVFGAAAFCGILLMAAPVDGQEAQLSREPGAQLRLPRQQAQTSAALDGTVKAVVNSSALPLPVSGAILRIQNLSTTAVTEATASGEGVFRIFPLLPGDYSLSVRAKDYAAFEASRFGVVP